MPRLHFNDLLLACVPHFPRREEPFLVGVFVVDASDLHEGVAEEVRLALHPRKCLQKLESVFLLSFQQPGVHLPVEDADQASQITLKRQEKEDISYTLLIYANSFKIVNKIILAINYSDI